MRPRGSPVDGPGRGALSPVPQTEPNPSTSGTRSPQASPAASTCPHPPKSLVAPSGLRSLRSLRKGECCEPQSCTPEFS